MTVWSGLVDRQEVGINWWVIRNPTQADPTFQVGWEVRQRTNWTSFNFDGEARWWGQSGEGSSRRRLSGSQEMVHGSGVMSFTAAYDRVQHFGIGAESRTWSNSGGSAATGWARMQRNGDIPRRPTGNPTNPGTPTTSNLTATSVRIAWTRPADMRGTSFVRDEWQVSTNANFTAVIRSGNQTGGAAIDVTGLAPGTRFWVRVRTVGNGWDASGRTSGWSGVREFRTPTANPNAPGTPGASGITSSAVTLTWAASNDMRGTSFVRYEWQVLNAATGAVVRSGNATTRSVNVTGLAHTTGFQARVRVVGNGWDQSGRTSPWSAVRAFTTLAVAPGQSANVGATRLSDTQMRLDWDRSTAGGTAQGHDIQTSINGAAWVDAWSVGNVASHTGAFAANRRQTFRVRPWNTISGNRVNGPWSAESAAIFSTPAAPGSVTAQREGGNIRVGWRNLVAFNEYRTEIQRGTVGANGTVSWVAGTVNVAAGGVAHVFAGLDPTQQHVFRVRAANLTGGLASPWVQSPVVQLTTVPLAPTMVVPPDAVRADEPFTVSWLHNPADGSAQTAFALQWSADGFQSEAGSTGRIATSAHTHTFPAGTFTAGQQLAFRVVTWGAHTAGGGDGTGRSPWSAGVPTRFVAPGVVAFLSPVNGGTATEAALSVTLGFTQPQGGTAVAAEVELSRSGVVVETTAATSLAGIPFTYRLSNGADYRLRARVRDTFGFWSPWASITFAVDFPLPIAADVGAVFLPDFGAAQAAVSLRGKPGEVVRTNLAINGRSRDMAFWNYQPGVGEQYVPRVTVTPETPKRINHMRDPMGRRMAHWHGAAAAQSSRLVLRDGAPADFDSFVELTTAVANSVGFIDQRPAITPGTLFDAGTPIHAMMWFRTSLPGNYRLQAITSLYGTPGGTAANGAWRYVPADSWVLFEETLPAGALFDRGMVRIVSESSPGLVPAGVRFAGTGALIEFGTTGAFFSGDTTPPDGATNAWAGTVDDSVSTQAFNDGPVLPTGEQIGTYQRVRVIEPKTGGNSGIFYRQDRDIALPAGQAVSVAVYARYSHPLWTGVLTHGRLSGQHHNDVVHSFGSRTMPANEWVRFEGTLTPAQASTGWEVWVMNGPGTVMPTGGTVDVTAVLIEPSARPGAFFDGDTQGDAWVDRVWAGAPHSSPSVETFKDAPAFVTVTRDAGDGPEVLIERLPWDGSAPLNLLDATPTLNGSNVYEVETITADGAASVGESFTLRTNGGRLAFLNTGGGMEHVLPMRGAVEVSRTAGRVSEVVDMAERTRPVTLYGANESLVLSVDVDELDVDGDRARAVERFMRTAGRTCYRDPSGLRTFGRVAGGLSGWRGRQARLSFELVESA